MSLPSTVSPVWISRCLLGLGILWGMLSLPGVAWAEGQPLAVEPSELSEEAPESLEETLHGLMSDRLVELYGELELQAISEALALHGSRVDNDPAGKRLRQVLIQAIEPIQPGDVLPLWLNRLHVTTRERVVRRALQLAPGEPWDEDLFRDAERDLRVAGTFAVVAIVPLESPEPGTVDALVVVRDAWSLQAGFSIATNGGVLRSLYLGASERNLAGIRDTLSLFASRSVGDWELGASYFSPHIAGSQVEALASASIILDRDLGERGGSASLQVARPLRTLRARWAWQVGVEHREAFFRRHVDDRLTAWEFSGDSEGASEWVPERARARTGALDGAVTRAWGTHYRLLLTPGWRFSWKDYTPAPVGPRPSDPALEAWVRERLPRSELSNGPTVALRFYEHATFRTVNVDSYSLAEERFQGIQLGVSARYSEPLVGSDVRYVRLEHELAHRQPLGSDAFVSASLLHALRLESGPVDQSISGALRLVSPTLWAGRWIVYWRGTRIFENGSNSLLALGADSGLRGYATGHLRGTQRWQTNLEWRSLPLRIRRVRLGGVVSLDVGGIADAAGPWETLASVGVGGRILIPALGTAIYSADLNFPFQDFGHPRFSVGVGQAF